MPYGVLRRFCRLWDRYRCLGIIAMLSMTLIVSGCGNWLFEDPSSPQDTRTTHATHTAQTKQNGAPPPPGNMHGTASSGQLTSPPAFDTYYVDPLLEIPPLDLNPNGSLGALGLNLDTYFAHNLDGMHTNEARITRLENVLSAMQKDLRRMTPPIQRLISIESDIKALVTQLSQLAQTEPDALTPQSSPQATRKTPIPAKQTAAAKQPQTLSPPPPSQASPIEVTPPAASPGTPLVQNIRIGEHADRTRIVLDLSSPASYVYDLDSSENLLIIELPGASWAAQAQWQGSKSPLIAAYSASAAGSSGSRLVIQLKQNAAILSDSVIKAENGLPHRIVLDLQRR